LCRSAVSMLLASKPLTDRCLAGRMIERTTGLH
jgi:hypothetical protein